VTPERRRALLQAGGLGLFGFLVFAVSFVFAFPYDRIKDQVVAIASTQNLDVDVGNAGPVFGVGVGLDEVMVRTRPEPGKKASVLQIDQARVYVSPLAQLRGVLAYEMDLRTLDGQITADVTAEKEKGITKIQTRDISMASLPGVKETINLPLGGTLELNLDITAPNHRNGEASGNLGWKWAGMVVGDGKEKLKVAGNPLLAEGISLPRIRLGDFVGDVVFNKGVGKLKGVGARSQDAEIRIEGEVRLADPLTYTYLDLYVTFKFSDTLLKSADKLQLMLQFADSMGKRPDGFYGFRLTGSPGRFGPVQWMKTSPFGTGSRASLDPRPGSPAAAPALERALPPPPSSPQSAVQQALAAAATTGSTAAAAAAAGTTTTANLDDGAAVAPNANLPRYVTSPPRE
jgi:type II secretion system protein N